MGWGRPPTSGGSVPPALFRAPSRGLPALWKLPGLGLGPSFIRGGLLAPRSQPSGLAPETSPNRPPTSLVPTDQARCLRRHVSCERAPPLQHPHCIPAPESPEDPRPQAPAPLLVSLAHGWPPQALGCALSPGRQEGFLSLPQRTAHTPSHVGEPEARRKPRGQVQVICLHRAASFWGSSEMRPLVHLPEATTSSSWKDPGPACQAGVTAVTSG